MSLPNKLRAQVSQLDKKLAEALIQSAERIIGQMQNSH